MAAVAKKQASESKSNSLLAEAHGILLRYSTDSKQYVVVNEKAVIQIIETGPFEWSMRVLTDAKAGLLEHPITSSIQYNISVQNHALTWGDTTTHIPYTFQFLKGSEKNEEEEEFADAFSTCVFSVGRKEKLSGLDKADQSWVTQGARQQMPTVPETKQESDEMDFIYDEVLQDSKEAEQVKQEEEEAQREHEEEVEQERVKAGRKSTRIATPFKSSKNSGLALSITRNRNFVLNGANVGVFKHGHDDDLQYLSGIVLKDKKGQSFSPSKVMLADGDKRLLMIDSHDSSRIATLDLERAEIVEEYSVDDLDFRSIAPTEKYAQRTEDQTFIGVNNNNVFRIDRRLPIKERYAEGKSYKTDNKMSSVATTGEGYTAVGSDKGDIRLFDSVAKNAKTLLPGLGAPIIGMDVTEDGKWVLATTKYFLLVCATERSDGRTGFEISMGKEKPVPIRLQLKPEDIAQHGIGEVSFTPAHFNTGDDISETWIVTSTGPFIVTWNFRKVKERRTDSYKIKRCDEVVVTDQFRFNMDDQVVVAEESTVATEKRVIKKK